MRIARRQLERPARVAFLRAPGRRYLVVGALAGRVRRGAALAGGLRAAIGLLSLALLALAAVLAG